MNQFKLSARTNLGMVRDHNEDNFIVSKDLANTNWTDLSSSVFSEGEMGALIVVADGMGGTEAGEVASEIAVRSVKDWFNQVKKTPASDKGIRHELSSAIIKAHDNIVADADRNPERYGMGTTIVLGWIIGDKAYIAWSGDSRAYIYRTQKEELELLTDDHSLVWDYVKSRQLTPEEARTHPDSNIINQSLGDTKRPPKPDTIIVDILEGDTLMLCSDGLNGMLSDVQMQSLFQSEKNIAELTNQLVQAANGAGGTDNITVVAIEATRLKEGSMITKKSAASSGSWKRFMIPLGLVLLAGFAYALWPSKVEPIPAPIRKPVPKEKIIPPKEKEIQLPAPNSNLEKRGQELTTKARQLYNSILDSRKIIKEVKEGEAIEIMEAKKNAAAQLGKITQELKTIIIGEMTNELQFKEGLLASDKIDATEKKLKSLIGKFGTFKKKNEKLLEMI